MCTATRCSCPHFRLRQIRGIQRMLGTRKSTRKDYARWVSGWSDSTSSHVVAGWLNVRDTMIALDTLRDTISRDERDEWEVRG